MCSSPGWLSPPARALARVLDDDPPPRPADPGVHHVLRHVAVGAVVLNDAVAEHRALQASASPDDARAVAAAAHAAALLQSALRDTDAFAEPWTGGDPLELIDALEQVLYSLLLLTDAERRSLALRDDELQELLDAPTVAGLLRDLPD